MSEPESSAPMVSVVVINHRSLKYLERCLASLAETRYPNFEVVVVDSLTEGVEQLVESFRQKTGLRLKLVHLDVDLGAAASHNIGVLASDPRAEYIVFLDNDVAVHPDWLSHLVEAISASPLVGAVQAKVLSMSNEGRMDQTGLGIDAAGTWLSAYGWEAELFRRPLVLFASSSAAMITRRSAYMEVMGFDDTYFIYDDDTDYSWRLRLRGYEVLFEPRALVWHEDKLSKRLSFEKLYFGFRNRLLNIVKNLDIGNMLRSLLLATYLGYVNAVLLALAGRGEEALAYVKALFRVYRSLRSHLASRMLVRRIRRVSDEELERRGFLARDLYATVLMVRALLVRYYKQARGHVPSRGGPAS